MTTRWSTSLRLSPRRAGIAAALVAGLAAPPAHATAATTTAAAQAFFKVKREKVTPAKAEAARADAQVKANALQQTGDPVKAGVALDEGAAIWGDPVLYLDAADMYLNAAEAQQDTGLVDAAEERARIARDISFFLLDSTADKNFRLVEISEVPGLISRADAILEKGATTRETINNAVPPEEETGEEEEEKKSKKKRDVPKILWASGIASASIGGALLAMGGVGLILGAVRQNEAEDPTVYGDEYDAVAGKGDTANLIAGLGLGLGGVFVVGGAAMMITSKVMAKRKGKGKKKKKKDKEPEDDNVVSISPTFGAGHSGLAISGRF